MERLEFGSSGAQAHVERRKRLEAADALFEKLDPIVAKWEAAVWPHNYRELQQLQLAAGWVRMTTQELVDAVRMIRAERRSDYVQGTLLE